MSIKPSNPISSRNFEFGIDAAPTRSSIWELSQEPFEGFFPAQLATSTVS
jgi:hypothetical protein